MTYTRLWICAATALLAAAATTAFAGGAAYVGTWDGAPIFVQIDVGDIHDPDGSAIVRVRAGPNGSPGQGAPWVDAAADATWEDGRVILTGTASSWSEGQRAVVWVGLPPEPGPVELRLVADALPGRVALDPFGSAVLTLRHGEAGGSVWIRLRAIGTMFGSRSSLADGTLDVTRTAPFFYAEPWSSLDLVGPAFHGVGDTIAAGLQQRRDLPEAVTGVWIEDRTIHVMSLTADMVSVLEVSYAYTGGAHPNTFYAGRTWLRTPEGWREAGLCEALAELDVPCPENRIRALVIDELERQEAYWVVEGEVTADTSWLLDAFTLTTDGIRFEFSPYDVGPNAQGPFVAFVPYAALASP